jgi:hypothetical protein
MKTVFLSVVILASINRGEVSVEHPEVAFKTPAIFGKTGTETPTGVFLVQKAYSTHLKRNILVFMQDGDAVYAIHSTVPVKGQQREARLASASPMDNRISNGCINIDKRAFDKLWNVKKPLILQVY